MPRQKQKRGVDYEPVLSKKDDMEANFVPLTLLKEDLSASNPSSVSTKVESREGTLTKNELSDDEIVGPSRLQDYMAVDAKEDIYDSAFIEVDDCQRNSEKPVTKGTSTRVKKEHEEEMLIFDIARSCSPTLGPPLKKQRLIVEVVLPTLEELKRKEAHGNDDSVKLKKIFKIKKTKTLADMALSDELLLSRLRPVGLDGYKMTLSRADLNVMVTRQFMSATYGGSSQGIFPSIGRANFARHGLNDFVYFRMDFQPYAPQIPGMPGLWFSTRHGDYWNDIKRVFTRDEKLPEWLYVGQYQGRITQSLTRDEWLSQSEKTKGTWATKIHEKKWGRWVRARIQARKELHGQEPTDDEVTATLENGGWKATEAADIRQAYDQGLEHLAVWTLKCVGYDDAFQLELCNNFPQWVRPPKKNGGEAKAKSEGAKNKGKKANSQVKGKKLAATTSSKKRKFVADSESESERGLKDEPFYTPRGTRSRPITLR